MAWNPPFPPGWHGPNRGRDSIWVMRDGGLIKVRDMEMSHIWHSLNKIQRDGWRESWLGVLSTELTMRFWGVW